LEVISLTTRHKFFQGNAVFTYFLTLIPL